ncbi:MAG: hypothetical protein CMJ18_24935 [Phycisphaeraceae bacterium]|nr:hypothetical protein [Phycisphaeraceae bacterium]
MLKALLIRQEDFEAVIQGFRLVGRKSLLFFETEFLQFEELAHRLLEALAALRKELLFLVLLFDEALRFRDLSCKARITLDEIRVEMGLFDFRVIRTLHGTDVLDDETEEPENEDADNDSNDVDSDAGTPGGLRSRFVGRGFRSRFGRTHVNDPVWEDEPVVNAMSGTLTSAIPGTS